MKSILLSFLLISTFSFGQTTEPPRIQIALLLDVSSSMNGLIDQTRAQIWQLVDELSIAQKREEYVAIEISILSFGGQYANSEKGYIEILSPLTKDLDDVADRLNELYAEGSQEYGGWAVKTAVDSLSWSDQGEDARFIIIAGNESFNQGDVDYVEACFAAQEKNIIVNTVYCGSYQHGVQGLWKSAADTVGGHYAFIDQNADLTELETPYDQKIGALNQKLLNTYVPYGTNGFKRYQRLRRQDDMAKRYGMPYLRQRAVFKSGRAYKNPKWDVIDAMDENLRFLKSIDKGELPSLFKDKSLMQIQQHCMKLSMQRELLKESILLYNDKAQEFIKIKTGASLNAPTLEDVILEGVKKQLITQGFMF